MLIRRDGNELYIESTAAPIRADGGQISGGVLVFHDVSESRELNRRLSYHASHDMLTGLVNRREFEARLERALQNTRALKNARSREAQYALCYMDLDQFKIVNDSCGHSAGDAMLGQLGALLKSKIRWRDTLARLGGDEFGVLLENCTVDEAIDEAQERVCARRGVEISDAGGPGPLEVGPGLAHQRHHAGGRAGKFAAAPLQHVHEAAVGILAAFDVVHAAIDGLIGDVDAGIAGRSQSHDLADRHRDVGLFGARLVPPTALGVLSGDDQLHGAGLRPSRVQRHQGRVPRRQQHRRRLWRRGRW